MKRWWPHIRAVLIALHIVAVVLSAVPTPGVGMKRSAWKEATVKGELDAWHDRIAVVAPDLSRAEFENELWRLGMFWSDGLRVVLRPFKPYHEYLGTEQSWLMFVAPHRYPARLWIELDERGNQKWTPLFVTRSTEYGWQADILDADRVRSAMFRYSWPTYSRGYKALGTWLARRAAEEFPDAAVLRTRWYRYRTPSPEEVREGREPQGTFEREQVYQLVNYRTPEAQ